MPQDSWRQMVAVEAPQTAVEVEITVAPNEVKTDSAEAPLVLAWLTPAEAEDFREHNELPTATIVPLISRAKVTRVSPDALLRGLHLRLPVPAEVGGVVPVALFDRAGTFWASLLDGKPGCLLGIADIPAPEGRTAITLRAPNPSRKQTHAAPRSELRRLTIPGPDGAARPIAARLPGDGDSIRRSCVYMLPGLNGDEMVRFNDTEFVEAMDVRGARAPLLLGISTRTPAGSAYPGAGDTGWADFLADMLPKAVDTALPTLPWPEQRVLAGQSTGGFSAVSLAMIRPGRFGAVVASAPDALDIEAWLLDTDGRIAAPWLAWMRLEAELGGAGQMTSFAVSWSPDPSGSPRWPVDLATGEVCPDVLDRWFAHSPMRLLDRPEVRNALRALRGRLFIGATRYDEFGLFEPTRRFCEQLSSLGIGHHFVVDEGSHFDVSPRLTVLVGAALDSLPPHDNS